MTQNAETTVLQHARELTRNAAQWLELLSFRSRPGVTPFGTNVCHYHAMLDPAASDVDRLTACQAMQLVVQRRMLGEEFEAEKDEVYKTVIDPYRAHWNTTRDGAAFWAIESLLSRAIRAFEAEDMIA